MSKLSKIIYSIRNKLLCNTIFMHSDCVKFRRNVQDIIDKESNEEVSNFCHEHKSWCQSCQNFFDIDTEITMVISDTIGGQSHIDISEQLKNSLKSIPNLKRL